MISESFLHRGNNRDRPRESAARELASNTQVTITKLNNNPGRVHMAPYKEYVAAQSNLATDLASMIGDFVEYARTKAKFEALTRKLELLER